MYIEAAACFLPFITFHSWRKRERKTHHTYKVHKNQSDATEYSVFEFKDFGMIEISGITFVLKKIPNIACTSLLFRLFKCFSHRPFKLNKACEKKHFSNHRHNVMVSNSVHRAQDMTLPDYTFHNSRASKSDGWSISCGTETSIDGFWGSHIAKCVRPDRISWKQKKST